MTRAERLQREGHDALGVAADLRAGRIGGFDGVTARSLADHLNRIAQDLFAKASQLDGQVDT